MLESDEYGWGLTCVCTSADQSQEFLPQLQILGGSTLWAFHQTEIHILKKTQNRNKSSESRKTISHRLDLQNGNYH